MNTILTILATLCVAANLVVGYIINFSLQENLPVMGYLGMATFVAFTLVPIACTGIVVYANRFNGE